MSTDIVAGKYRLVRAIGRGAMGEIWEALDQHLRRRVALKLMSPELVASQTARVRFDREARAIAQLHNPHVVQIYDYGIDGGSPYIVMELLEGEDLEARFARVGRMTPAALAPIVAQAALALGAAHAKGIIHRDLKPANVFLARDESGEVVKILDFGVVSMLGADEASEDDVQLTAQGGLVGTPLYMSPEQIRSSPIDHRSDLWSLGVLAYRALAGQTPFVAQFVGMLMVRICTDSFAPPSSVVPELSPDVDAFFERALAKDPERRFASAKELAAAFTALAEPRDRGPTKLLVVDDETDVQALILQRFRAQIRRGAYQFVFAVNGEHALAQLREHPDIDVVVSDINMPVMDGLTLLSRIGEESPLVRTIIVSAYGDMQNIRTAMNRGAFDFLVKPISFKDLEVTIEKTLRHVRALRRHARSTEENSVLRMFVSPDLVERLRPGGPAGASVWEGTVARIGLVDFHAHAADLDPDDRVRTLNANFEVIVPAITGRGGVVDRILGDAVVAVFRGDDHAARALSACLDLRQQLRSLAARAGAGSPFALGVSIGVATGELVAGEVGSRAFGRLDYSVLGDVPRAAADLRSAAGRNAIRLDRATLDQAGNGFQCAPAGDGDAFELLRRVGDVPRRVDGDARPLDVSTHVFVRRGGSE